MFELITGEAKHTPRNQSLPILVSTAAHVAVLGLVIAVPLLYVTENLPEIPTTMAFVAAPPTPPPPPAPPGPVRIGGQVQAPALVRRVEPFYPPLAAAAHIQGVVILESIIDEEGAVSDVRVLRSVNPVLDREAILAVRQWRYSPLLLNGIRVPFVLTVTLSFMLQNSTE